MKSHEQLLEAKRVSKLFGKNQVLYDVDFDILPGEIHALIGENGAGKSTLLRTIFGLLASRRGQIILKGQDITNRAPDELVLRGLSYVPQVDNVFQIGRASGRGRV